MRQPPRWLQIAGLALLTVVVLVMSAAALRSAGPAKSTLVVTPLPPLTLAPTPAPATLSAARAVLASQKPVTVVVLGDSTGAHDGEWVQLWAKHLGSTRSVTLHQWDSTTDAWMRGVERFGKRGVPVVVWNMSKVGGTATYPAARIAQITRPDLVILSFGHYGSPDGQRPALSGLQAAAPWLATVPTVVILENPETGSRAVIAADSITQVGLWARLMGLPTLDVGAAFIDSGHLGTLVLPDGVRPSAAGSALWATSVASALG